MEKKGELGLGMFLMAFVAVIAGLALFQGIASNVGSTQIVADANQSLYTSASSVNVGSDLVGQEYIGGLKVWNRSSDMDVTGNFTVIEGVSTSTGLKRVQLVVTNETWAGKTVNVSYTYGADGYVESSGARSVVGIIAIFAALAIAVVALVPTLRSGIMDLVR